ELILGADSEEIDGSSDSDSESGDAEDEGPTAEDEDPATGDEGLATGAVLKGQQQGALVVRTTVSMTLGLGYGSLRRQELALEEDRIYTTLTTWTDPKDSMVYIDVPVYPPPIPPVQTPPSPD
nr:hypothetical protein [Tanacetum cinerariifolium]